jgi:trigger factor
MVQGQIDHEIEEMGAELAERGISMEQYLEAMKGTRYQLEKAIRDKVVESLKAELVMDSVAAAEDIKVSDEEVEQYVRENATQVGADSEKLIKQARDQGRIPVIKANLRLNKAVEFLAENAVYAGGEPAVAEEAAAVQPQQAEADQAELNVGETAEEALEPEVIEAETVTEAAEPEAVNEEGPE